MSLRRATRIWLSAGSMVVAALTPGCGKESRLLSIHMADDQKAQARQRWDEVRGGVKLQIARQHFEAGRIDEAEGAIEEAMGLCPRDARVFVLAARLRLEQGRLAEAREAVRIAQAMAPADAEAAYVAGLVELRYGDLESAVEQFAVATATAPQKAEYLSAQAETLLALNRPVEAWESLQGRLDDFEGDAGLRRLAARIHRALGLRDPAVQWARDALRCRPDDPAARREFGSLLVWAGNYIEAIDILEPFVSAAGDDGEAQPDAARGLDAADQLDACQDLAKAHLALGHWADAQRVLRLTARQWGDDSLCWSMYARAAVEANDLSAADQALDLALRGTAAAPESLVLASFVALQRGDFARARHLAGSAVRGDPKCVTGYCLMGQAEEGLGRPEAARAEYAAALAIDSRFTLARELNDRLSTGPSPVPANCEEAVRP